MFLGPITNTEQLGATTKVFLDSPGTASPVTYKMQTRVAGLGTAFFNRSGALAASDAGTSLTAIEVGG